MVTGGSFVLSLRGGLGDADRVRLLWFARILLVDGYEMVINWEAWGWLRLLSGWVGDGFRTMSYIYDYDLRYQTTLPELFPKGYSLILVSCTMTAVSAVSDVYGGTPTLDGPDIGSGSRAEIFMLVSG